MAESEPAVPSQEEWYPQLLTPMDGRELSTKNQQEVLAAVYLAMQGIERALARGKIVNAQISFEVVHPDGNVEFNYSAPEE